MGALIAEWGTYSRPIVQGPSTSSPQQVIILNILKTTKEHIEKEWITVCHHLMQV